MNLPQLKAALGDLYPPLRTRSGRKIVTTEASGQKTPDGLLVTIKTVFPPSARRRSDLIVTLDSGELRVSPRHPAATADALRFAELARERAGASAPLRCVKDTERRNVFVVSLGAQETPPTLPSTPDGAS